MYQPKTFFNLEDFEWKNIFENVENAWEAVPELKDCVYLFLWQKYGMKVSLKENFCYREKGVIIEKGVTLKGQILIGENSEIRSGAYLRGPVIIGKNCVVGNSSEIKNSILLDGAKAPHFNYVGDSILGNNVNLGAGSVLANLKHSHSMIKVGKISTGLRKFGAIVGDEAQIGCNAVLAPGTIIEKNGWVYPNDSLEGFWTNKLLLKRMLEKSKESRP
ncbi:MAG: glucose-1-phosphate thymidylyltransferase [Candidatus Paceibacterota bacterium]